MKRRPFLKIVGAVAGSYSVGLKSSMASEATQKLDEIGDVPRREIGKTGVKIPMVCLPGLALTQYDQETCNTEVHRSIERGWNHLDVAPAYGDAEIRMGIALQGIERSRYFLSCKTKKRDKEGAREELERSLERLKTDYFDLYQLHHLRSTEEVQKAFGPGGAMETLFKAKEEGKIGLIGFSAHTTKSALAALKQYKFDTVMFPINYVEYFTFDFGKEVVDMAAEQGASVLAMKTVSSGLWPEGAEHTRKWWYRPLEEQSDIDMAVHFSLSQKAVATVVPVSFLDIYDKCQEAAKTFQPISEEKLNRLKEMALKSRSVFLEEQKQFTMGESHRHPTYPYDCPHSHHA